MIKNYKLHYIMSLKNNIKNGFYKFAKEYNLGRTLSAYAMGWTFLQLLLSFNDLFSEWLINDLTYDEWIEKKKKIYKKLIDFIIVIFVVFFLLKILRI